MSSIWLTHSKIEYSLCMTQIPTFISISKFELLCESTRTRFKLRIVEYAYYVIPHDGTVCESYHHLQFYGVEAIRRHANDIANHLSGLKCIKPTQNT